MTPNVGIDHLSPRKRQTLDGLLSGLSEKEIANGLGLSLHTVHDYVKSLYRQFGVSTRGELLATMLGPQRRPRERMPAGPPTFSGAGWSAVSVSPARRVEEISLKQPRSVAPAVTQARQDGAEFAALGSRLLTTGRAQEAVEKFGRAVACDPQNPNHRINLAAAYGAVGRPDAAINQLIEAILIKGNIPELHNNLGASLTSLGRFDEAAAAYRNAIALRSDYVEAHKNLAKLLERTGQLGASAAGYAEVLRLSPSDSVGLHGLAGVSADIGDVEETIRCYRRLLALHPSVAAVRSSLLYTLHYSAAYGPAELFTEHAEWGRLFCAPTPSAPDINRSGRRVRVGYVSPDFREHTVPRFISAALEHYDRTEFEVFCYSDVSKPDQTTARLRASVQNWKDTRSLSIQSLADEIRADGIDILVDLRGHAAENRLPLFGCRPAPVQVSMVGYFDTTGLPTMDYRVTDQHMDPPGQTEQYHTERLVRLPASCWCYTADAETPGIEEPPARANGYVTFGCLNKLAKISPQCADSWAKTLELVPGSKLLLPVSGRPDSAGFMVQRLEAAGIPSNRLVLCEKAVNRNDYLRRFNEIDIVFDTYPFNGITTTCDGLWMGVPHVSLSGATSVSRAGRSILCAVGLPDAVAITSAEFARVASELADDLDRLRALRVSMRDRMRNSPLMDAPAFAQNLEAAYREMLFRCGA